MTGYDREEMNAIGGEWTDVPAAWLLACGLFLALLIL